MEKMNHKTVFRKTRAGEDAVKQRTRLIQRNTRMVLILVDGMSSVEELARKIGNPLLAESALKDLQQAGLIEPRLDSLGVSSEVTKKPLPLQEVDGAKGGGRSVPKNDRNTEKNHVDQVSVSEHAYADKNGPAQPILDTKKTLAQGAAISETNISSMQISGSSSVVTSGSVPLASSGTVPEISLGQSETIEHKAEQQGRATSTGDFSVFSLVQADVGNSHLRSGSVDTRGKGDSTDGADKNKRQVANTSSQPCEEETGPDLTDLRLLREKRARFWGIFLAGVLVVLSLVAASVILFPSERFRPEVEASILHAIGREAKVSTLRVAFTPSPAIVLGDVLLGEGSGALRISEIRLQPVLSSLFASRKVFNKVTLVGVEISKEQLIGISDAVSRLSAGTNFMQIRQISVERAGLVFPGGVLGDLFGELLTTERHVAIHLQSADRQFRVMFPVDQKLKEGQGFTFEAYGWRPASDNAWVIDSMKLNGLVSSNRIDIQGLEISTMDGVLNGTAIMEGESNRAVLRGVLSFERLNAVRIAEAFGQAPILQGDLAGEVRFALPLTDGRGLLTATEAEGRLTSHRGSLRNVDFAEAIRRGVGKPVQGGATSFEQLNVRFTVKSGSVLFSPIQFSSGLLQSRGVIDVTDNGKLSGRFDVQMRGSANQSKALISLAGSLKTPVTQQEK